MLTVKSHYVLVFLLERNSQGAEEPLVAWEGGGGTGMVGKA